MTKQQRINAIAEATQDELFNRDPEWNCWMADSTETYETIDDFIAAALDWREWDRTLDKGTVGGCAFVHFGRVQALQGQDRRPLTVVDLGDVRVALHVYPSDYPGFEVQA